MGNAKANSRSPARREFLKRSAAALASLGLTPSLAEEPSVPFVPVRTITAGVNVTAANFEAVLESAAAFLDRAERLLQSAGFTIQTKRIATQPHADYLAGLPVPEAITVVREMQALLGEVGAGYALSVGPGLTGDRYASDVVERALEIARLGASTSIVIGTHETGVHYDAIRTAAEVIRAIASDTPLLNMNFGAVANVAPGVPFFPGAYHGSGVQSFTLGTEGAELFMRVCAEATSLAAAEQSLFNAYSADLQALEAVAKEIAAETSWQYAGIDTTPAQWGERSIGTAIEHLIGAPFGTPGTLAACQMMTRVIRRIPVKRTGYSGLFLPPLEDATLARRAYDYYGLDALLSYSAVCGTGLDALAIPGDVSVRQLQRILADVASLAVRLNKPLTGRLLPMPGRQAGESSGPVGDLTPMKILRVG